LAQGSRQVVSIAPPQKITAKRGTTGAETLEVTVQNGYHVNSNKPKDEFLIPLKLSWVNGPLATRQILYPSATQTKVGGETLDVFTGTFAIKTEFAVPPQAMPGIAMMQGTLHYQACDSVSCKRPASVTVQVPVTIQ
jgi:hypothetical protein